MQSHIVNVMLRSASRELMAFFIVDDGLRKAGRALDFCKKGIMIVFKLPRR